MISSARDVWGAAYRDASLDRLGTLLIRRDDGVADDASSLLRTYFEPLVESDVQLLARLSGRVLDIGCGAGRHTLWLQEHGVEVTGVDSSAGAIEVARERGCRDVHLASIETVDFADGFFGGAILLANGAGIAGTEERSASLFRGLARMVRPGGLLIAQGHDPLRTSDPAHLAYHQANREAGRPPGQLRLRMEYGGAAWRMVRPAALRTGSPHVRTRTKRVAHRRKPCA